MMRTTMTTMTTTRRRAMMGLAGGRAGVGGSVLGGQ
jgi:hypothetical protein